MSDRTQSPFQNITLRARTRLINNTKLINRCQFSVSFKEILWKSLYSANDVSSMFNNVHYMFKVF